MQTTVAIIKPDAVRDRHVGDILSSIEEEGLTLVAMHMFHYRDAVWREFYQQHKALPFFEELILFMSSGPVVVMILEGENAISRWRALMGATDPYKAKHGTLRQLFGTKMPANACHGSDSLDAARQEAYILWLHTAD